MAALWFASGPRDPGCWRHRVKNGTGSRRRNLVNNKALGQLLEELHERYTSADVRKGFVARDAATEAMLRFVAWMANLALADEPAHEQVWYGLELFVDHPVLSTYKWLDSGGRL